MRRRRQCARTVFAIGTARRPPGFSGGRRIRSCQQQRLVGYLPRVVDNHEGVAALGRSPTPRLSPGRERCLRTKTIPKILPTKRVGQPSKPVVRLANPTKLEVTARSVIQRIPDPPHRRSTAGTHRSRPKVTRSGSHSGRARRTATAVEDCGCRQRVLEVGGTLDQ
jgi:hypothetical protein